MSLTKLMNLTDIFKLDQYKDFVALDQKKVFKDLFHDCNYDVVQLHSCHLWESGDVVGFCGSCSWKNNELTSLDGDSYIDTMGVVGYNEFTFVNNREEICKRLDILVDEW